VISSDSPTIPAPDTTAAAPASGSEIKACWSAIGVYGNGACTELSQFVHCRNCPTYSNAAVQLLNRPLPPEYRREWTDHFAAQRHPREPSKTSAVLFRIASEWLALPTQAFQEVAERRQIHSLPHRRHTLVLGLANVRGELLVCVSLGHLLGLERMRAPESLRTAYHRLLVGNWEGSRLAFPVDEVHGPHRFHPEELRTPPATVAKSAPTYTRSVLFWQQRAVGLLDAELLFSCLNRTLT
jgi:chemotaxis-related protein WspD